MKPPHFGTSGAAQKPTPSQHIESRQLVPSGHDMSDSQVANSPVVPELDSLDAAVDDVSLLLVVLPSTLPLSVLVELVAEVVIVELALLVSLALVLPDDVSTVVVTVVVGFVAPVVASSSPPHAASAITYARPRGIRCKRVIVMRAVSIAKHDCVKESRASVRATRP